ncbi:Prephenate dehydratase-domain-containing protein [Coprinopsis sp. MPI-PUGE-AT-0042]|nr:Prephenate dehydratase-domain-containing protein [Coprinopsis sp. MPI-PUGE-AT-0042]
MRWEPLKTPDLLDGCFFNQAADRYFGQAACYEEKQEIKDVFHALSPSGAEFGVVPQENTIFGSVIETYDSLRGAGDHFVVGEKILRIEHCLLVGTGVKLDQIHTVLSHEQALGQCRVFIQTHLPNAVTIKTSSTASAARSLLDRSLGHAAISSRVCATIFPGLEVLKSGIQSDSDNYTRFYILARDRDQALPLSLPEPPLGHRALFRVPIRTSGTRGIQDIFPALDVNVTRIDRRPLSGVPFSSIYIIEVGKQSLDGIDASMRWRQWAEEKAKDMRRAGFEMDLIGCWSLYNTD